MSASSAPANDDVYHTSYSTRDLSDDDSDDEEEQDMRQLAKNIIGERSKEERVSLEPEIAYEATNKPSKRARRAPANELMTVSTMFFAAAPPRESPVTIWVVTNRVITEDGKVTSQCVATLDSLSLLKFRQTHEAGSVENNGAPLSLSKLFDPDGYPQNTNMLVYIHGYNNTFENAVSSAATVARRAGVQEIVCFAWPSAGHTLWYFSDEDMAEKTAPFFAYFLHYASQKLVGHAVLNILAHSLGNRILLWALLTLFTNTAQVIEKTKLGKILCAAADVDQKYFTKTLRALSRDAERMDMMYNYASNGDSALLISSVLHRTGRGGLITSNSSYKYRAEYMTLLRNTSDHSHYVNEHEVYDDWHDVLHNRDRERRPLKDKINAFRL